ncbi:glycosyltransferase family 2 protein [Aurantimonas sp. HBX-1]|uniref:glycosyltransferase n=1 Tax=Aurantimonas sp. HBX-1 TaxID=2906072 RepID=UPI001F3E3413|nr:glycosyltransferase [Aurantimonas sp. HBX-1]UIJ73128.1 glycosyltransferase [Aurantimonas sp. HBX-1]
MQPVDQSLLLRAPGSTAVDGLHPVVAIPAKNEAERLPRLVAALAAQSWLSDCGRMLDVVLVLNNCRDESAALLAAAASRHPQLRLHIVEVDFPRPEAHAGSARRLAMETARSLVADPARSVLLTTDADGTPHPAWVDANLRSIAAGADLVGGLIVGDKAEEALLGDGFRRRARRQVAYGGLCDRLTAIIDPIPYDPWPRHHDHTGASLAVRADAYDAVGGLPALPRREDLTFVSRLRAAGYRLRHDPDVVVTVSARTFGRARGGMADCLKSWIAAEASGRPHLVEAPVRVRQRALRRSMLRRLAAAGDADEIAVLANRLALFPADLHDDGGRLLSPEALVERHAPDEPDAPATVPVDTAMAAMARLIDDITVAADAA